MPRFHCPVPLQPGAQLSLPAGAARHVQVLRLQPGETITLFNGEGGEHTAIIERMGRQDVDVRVESHVAVERETERQVHIAMGMPANERMDWLVEKATELGVASIQPLQTERSVLRLSGERAQKKQDHWQALAVAACEQCGRNRVPTIHPVRTLAQWLATPLAGPGLVLSPQDDSPSIRDWHQAHAHGAVTLLSGPEGGLSVNEVSAAQSAGWQAVQLGPRILRAETAPLAALGLLTL